MGFPGAIFDLDGTVANSLHDLAEATNWGLGQLRMPTWSVRDYRLMVGDGRTMLCRRALRDRREELVLQLEDLMTGYYEQHCFDHTTLYPGIEQLLVTLCRANVKLAVLSNKPQNFVEVIVHRLIPTVEFDALVGDSDDVSLKPDPAAALAVADRLSLAAEQIAFVGDTSIDMKTANRAGMVAIGVTWGFRDRQELERSGAKIMVDNADQLGRVLLNGRVED